MKNELSDATAGSRPPREAFALRRLDGGESAPVLCGVEARGRLDGVLFELTLRQTYRNTGPKPLEVIYTFPLPHAAVLLGFASELAGRRQEGVIVAKRQAEAQYEQALAEGDAPVMLEAGPDGLHTANIGNLKPGEEIVLEVRFAQLLAFEQGRLRLVLPTTIAPRYGSAVAAGLQPQQEPVTSLQAEYPLALGVEVRGSLAAAAVACPTHTLTTRVEEGRLRLTLDRGAWLDRDVVILITPADAQTSLVFRSHDGRSSSAPVVLMAAFQPQAGSPRQAVALKLLVDCSGSMSGDSIESARAALQGVVEHLTAHDQISLTRFGSTHEHLMQPAACSAPALRRAAYLVQSLEADLGGTEMQQALEAVFDLPVPESSAVADVLLVTDGEIWQVREMIEMARARDHRVFVIGVGSSPAEAPLRQLAEATGGACEFATPGEALEAAAARMLGRIRQRPWRGARIDWGTEPVWQTALPAGVFGGDRVLAFAGFDAAIETHQRTPAVRLLAKSAEGSAVLAQAEVEATAAADTLPRIAAARRMAAADAESALTLALDYQLMSAGTNCMLVHERADADRTVEQPELHRINSMLAAGWGGTGKVMAGATDQDAMLFSLASPDASAFESRVKFRIDVGASAAIDPLPVQSSLSDLDAESWSDTPHVRRRPSPDSSLTELARLVADHLDGGGQVRELPPYNPGLTVPAAVASALQEAEAIGATDGAQWLILASWVVRRAGGEGAAGIGATLEPHLARLDAALIQVCLAMFDERLGQLPIEGIASARVARLARALGWQQPHP